MLCLIRSRHFAISEVNLTGRNRYESRFCPAEKPHYHKSNTVRGGQSPGNTILFQQNIAHRTQEQLSLQFIVLTFRTQPVPTFTRGCRDNAYLTYTLTTHPLSLPTQQTGQGQQKPTSYAFSVGAHHRHQGGPAPRQGGDFLPRRTYQAGGAGPEAPSRG